ncbi:MAG: winged helix DNA-binding domain-containing protein, partial [Propionibacteriaceae bacterium]|nr:winged helix DNA-binding domain-containing protein [Propionibacteriaceae bacterium]
MKRSLAAEPVLTISDEQRRARLARRQALAPWARLKDPVETARAVVALHATESASVHLALHARMTEVTVDQIDAALYAERTLVKQLAMRQTLFAFPRDLLPAALGSASARVAGPLRRTLAKEAQAAGLADDGEAWLAEAARDICDLIDREGPVTAAQVRTQLPHLAARTARSPGTKWGGEFPIAPRILALLSAEGLLVRAANAGPWRLNKPPWTTMTSWSGAAVEPREAAEGYAELVCRWLWSFGPGTEADLVWWLGATKTAVRTALAELEAVPVGLEGDRTGYLLPDDPAFDRSATDDDSEPWATLLPALDPTTMGYREREFYLDPAHVPYLFDTVGNGGATAWWNGRIVGNWVQDDDARVQVMPRHDLTRDA